MRLGILSFVSCCAASPPRLQMAPRLHRSDIMRTQGTEHRSRKARIFRHSDASSAPSTMILPPILLLALAWAVSASEVLYSFANLSAT